MSCPPAYLSKKIL